MPELAPALALLTTPAILFFVMGILAAMAGSDLELPEPVSKCLSLYLMLAIGFKGGVEAREAGLSLSFGVAASLGLLLSAGLPLLAWAWLRRIGRLDRATAAAMAAAYGSVSVVTFAAAQQHLANIGLPASGFMAAVLALMEAPAILTALVLMRRRVDPDAGPAHWPAVLRESALGSAGVMLLGSFAVGFISGPPGMAKLEIFVGPLFQGVLCLFLLELGLQAARGLIRGRARLSPSILAFCLAFPVCSALAASALARAAGLGAGDSALLAVLAGSASYIAVPAAMRVAAPDADPTLYVTGPLVLTFPFNLLIGIASYAALAQALSHQFT